MVFDKKFSIQYGDYNGIIKGNVYTFDTRLVWYLIPLLIPLLILRADL